MAKKIKEIPKKHIEIDKGFRTKFLQNSLTGRMVGRQGREKGHLPKLVVARIDNSPAASMVRRVKAKKGVYGEHRGEIFGRSSKVIKHKRKSKKGKKHTVKKHRRTKR